ncbi:hypothetical protein [Paenibacillus sp. NAIST15-1]|uniref:hypothetical protein n=1 Tax=Paenibacillus sp. NAIST15-1 TaxID=1605994 RepID=UPI00086DB482|nr:hypothetical protein [Paenibacillus sp. NAIST15-1]GAV11470.1 type II secretion system protein E [Paenibacillus sp. NAIST15-1]
MTNSEIINLWINEQIEAGKTDKDIDGTTFYDKSDVYTIKKTKRKHIFDLKCTLGGGIDLNSLKNIYVNIEKK